jgi:hypothetical protein
MPGNASGPAQILQHQIQNPPQHSVSQQQIIQQSQRLQSSNPQTSTSQNQSAGTVGAISYGPPFTFCPVKRQICSVTQSSQRTVKMFRTYFYGETLKAKGFAIGDSAAEITLVKSELVDALGIQGEECMLNLQWTDFTVKSSLARKVKIKISGTSPNDEMIVLNECYAVKDFNLPPRSLNMEELKRKFPHLQNVPFESYENAVPTILIGSRHAYALEAVQPVIHGGCDMPIALKSKLGYTVYGGAPEQCEYQTCAVQSVSVDQTHEPSTDVTNKMLEDMYKYACSIDNLGIKQKDVYYTRLEKKAMELVEEEMRILQNGSVELPLIWNRDGKSIPTLPNNYAMVLNRQIAHEKKLSKGPEFLKAFNENFKELIKKGYVREATSRDLNTQWPNIWYLLMSLVVNQNKEPVKTRNVYHASARYRGTSLNENLLMGPNLLVDMLAPLMRMRLYK